MRGRLAISTAGVLLLSLIAPISASTAQAPAEWPEDFSARLVTVQETGPPSERLNLIVMCEGYQADEMEACVEDVDRNQAVQFSVEPFRTYRHYMNVYRLEIVSPDSGVRCDPDVLNAFLDTPLRLGFATNCPAGALARGVTYQNALVEPRNGSQCPQVIGDPRCTGAQQRTMYLDAYVAPALGIPSNAQNLQTLAIFNSFTYGGIGGTHATTSGGSPQGPLVSTHELGHSLGSMADEYPYSSRTNPGNPAGNNEPGSFHHTRMTSEQMIANQAKWFRWLGEESLAGGEICARDCLSGAIGHESGNTNGSNIWRPSSHSMMRWIGFYFDQVGREHMVARITGQRNTGQMHLGNTPVGEVPGNTVLWVDPMNPKFHELDVTWRIGGPDGAALATGNARNLALAGRNLEPGTVVHVEVRDPVGPDGLDWVRNPSTANTATNSGFNGPRFVQTRQWTVAAGTVTPTPPGDVDLITGASPTDRPVGGEEVVYIQTGHPSDRVLTVTWRLNGAVVAGSTDRTIDLGALNMPVGTHQLTATVTDPATGGGTETLTWAVDNVAPTAERTLSEPLVALGADDEHNVYFSEFDMLLEAEDDRTGYDEELYVVAELRLNGDGWFNYFGFPEQPFGTPFNFSHSGKDVKALTYGSLGTGGLSKATFEQSYGPNQPNGPFVPGFGTHFVEHRAIDPAGTIGEAGDFHATVLPGELAECTQTLTGTYVRLVVAEGVTCLDGAVANGGVSVLGGASLVATDSTINGELKTRGADTVQIFGSRVNGRTSITGTTRDVTAAGNTFNGLVVIDGTTQVQANEQFALYGYQYGPILVGNTFGANLRCADNNAPARDFGAPNTIVGNAGGDCSEL